MSTQVREQAQVDRHDDEDPPPTSARIEQVWPQPLRALPFIFGADYDRVVDDLDWGIVQNPGTA
ncbi:hypothetical protein [Subtercola sp. Z020]|uniref:hypothetical protein n=1 Tax=Subtercola sp. Z020 TaxID=2080582 RepID=UPI0011B057B6|nr:hypothetical protein [Subtercola sp. Z020]